MATRILEYGGYGSADHFPAVPPIITAQSPLTASGTSQQSAATSNGSALVCVQSDEAVHVAVGSSPTATTSHYKVKAGDEQFFVVPAGQKIAIIQGT